MRIVLTVQRSKPLKILKGAQINIISMEAKSSVFIPQLTYISCSKGGYHDGEPLNIVCLAPACSTALCCLTCVEEAHKDHQTKSLKRFISEARENFEKNKQPQLNSDIFTEVLHSGESTTTHAYERVRSVTFQRLETTASLLKIYFAKLSDKITLRCEKSNQNKQQLFADISKMQAQQQLQKALTTLRSMIKAQGDSSFSQEDIVGTLKGSSEALHQQLEKLQASVSKAFDTFNSQLESMTAEQSYFPVTIHFDPIYKHKDLQIVEGTKVKMAGNSSGYRFALTKPHLENGPSIRTLTFAISENDAWTAFGVCHRKVVESKQYQFEHQNIGHGGYMVSSNGGVWSNIHPSHNNIVKTFSFKKGDKVSVQINFAQEVIRFRKNFRKQPENSYEMPFKKVQGDELCGCVLLYYSGSMVELAK